MSYEHIDGMWILAFRDYKSAIKAEIKKYPKQGRGQSRKLAEHLGVQPIVVSQIFAGKRHLTIGQAIEVAKFFVFDDRTTEYFLCLVELAYADTAEAKAHYQKRLDVMRDEFQKVRSLAKGRRELNDTEKGMYYSNWFYSAVRVYSSIKGFQSKSDVAERLNLTNEKVGAVVSFLLETGLCVEEDGQLKVGIASTFVPDTSPFANSHRRNWRLKAMEQFSNPNDTDYFFSCPVSISKKDAEAVRKEILAFIKSFYATVDPSPMEKAMCLNIDWFNF